MRSCCRILARTGWAYLSLFFINVAAAQDDEKLRELWGASQKAMSKADYKSAEEKLDAILKLAPKLSSAFYYRGRVRFQGGDIAGSIADFDKHVELSPDMKSRQWERGISLYYGNKFKEGAKQFEIYQTYHDNDVENSAWRFLCVARSESIEAARKNLLPIRNDRRIPMMQIYEMYQGKKTPADVLQAAEELPVSERERNSAKFYANLYVGLMYEVQGERAKAAEHIKKARSHKIDHYMWDVANIHQKLRNETFNKKKDREQKKSSP